MADQDPQRRLDDRPARRRYWRSLPAQGTAILILALLVSALLHLLSGRGLTGMRPSPRVNANLPKGAIKVRVIDKATKNKKPPKEVAQPKDAMPQILEVPQEKTAKPTEADYVGHVDHATTKETRISDKTQRDRAKDPGQKGKPNATKGQEKPQSQTQQEAVRKRNESKPTTVNSPAPSVTSASGTVQWRRGDQATRSAYQQLLPTGVTDLPGQINNGYQDYVDEKIQEGERIDINTTEYRFIGYFTNMRKAIELVWNYPIEAARSGLQGEVGLEFAIAKDGKATHVKVIKSSGYEVLDRAIVDAIRLASPFAPLPEGFGKDRILVTGSFRYILSAYGSH